MTMQVQVPREGDEVWRLQAAHQEAVMVDIAGLPFIEALEGLQARANNP